MINLLLLIISIIMGIILMPISFIYSILRAVVHGGLSEYFWKCALSIDQTGNTVCQFLFNDIMIKPNGHRCGNPDETVSHVLGKNKAMNTLYPTGKFIAWILNKIDKNHVEKAVINEQ